MSGSQQQKIPAGGLLGHHSAKSLRGNKGKKYGGSHRPFALLVDDEHLKSVVYGRRRASVRKKIRELGNEAPQEKNLAETASVRSFASDLDKNGTGRYEFFKLFGNGEAFRRIIKCEEEKGDIATVKEWLGQHGYLNPVERKYFETHELVTESREAATMKSLFERSTSAITRAFAVKWLEARGAVRKIHAQAPADEVAQEHEETGSARSRSLQGSISTSGETPTVMKGRRPVATWADVVAFEGDWLSLKEQVEPMLAALGVAGCTWANQFEWVVHRLASRPTNPTTQQELLDKLNEIGLLEHSAKFDADACREAAFFRVGNAFANRVKAAQTIIAKELVWRVLDEAGLVTDRAGKYFGLGNKLERNANGILDLGILEYAEFRGLMGKMGVYMRGDREGQLPTYMEWKLIARAVEKAENNERGKILIGNGRIEEGEQQASGQVQKEYSEDEMDAIALKYINTRPVLGKEGVTQTEANDLNKIAWSIFQDGNYDYPPTTVARMEAISKGMGVI